MIKIITAMNNPKINDELKNEKRRFFKSNIRKR